MAQQVGSTSGTAATSRETEVSPGGASELTSESRTAGGASGGASVVTEADWQEPGSPEPAGLGPAVTIDPSGGLSWHTQNSQENTSSSA